MNGKWGIIGGFVVVAVLAVVIDRTVLFWSGEDGALPDDVRTALGNGPSDLPHHIQGGSTYTFEEADRGSVVDFTQPATALLKGFKKGYYLDVLNRSSGPVTVTTESGWLIGGHPTLDVPPGYRCTLVSEGDGYEIVMMSNKP